MLLNVVLVSVLLVCELFLMDFLVALFRDKLSMAPQLRLQLFEMPLLRAPQACRKLGCVDGKNDR